jgi:hypothetical protein
MVDLGHPVTLSELDKALVDNFATCFAQDPTACDTDTE